MILREPEGTGGRPLLFEPFWGIEVALTPLEHRLLDSFPLRRLHLVSHMGAARFGTPMVHSRLQHTLGVFALVARYAPDDREARLAALLHDVGHPPFSHALELIEGVDHHAFLRVLLHQEPLAGLFTGQDLARIEALVSGAEASPLKNRAGSLHADNLDSWMRGGQALGLLGRGWSPPELLERLVWNGRQLVTDEATAEWLAFLILEGARFQLTVLDLAANAFLAHLTGDLIRSGALERTQLPTMTDADLMAMLLASPHCREGARKLFFEPQRLRARPLAAGEANPPGTIEVAAPPLYLSMPATDRGSILERSPALREALAELRRGPTRFSVWMT